MINRTLRVSDETLDRLRRTQAALVLNGCALSQDEVLSEALAEYAQAHKLVTITKKA